MGRNNLDRLEDRLNCLGYYGVGTGWTLGRNKNQSQTGYCDTCRFRAECWDKHRDRVRLLFPDLSREFEAFVEEYKKAGKPGGVKMLVAWQEYIQQPPDRIQEPFTAVMMGNIEDGLFIYETGKPKERQGSTLPYPFVKV